MTAEAAPAQSERPDGFYWLRLPAGRWVVVELLTHRWLYPKSARTTPTQRAMGTCGTEWCDPSKLELHGPIDPPDGEAHKPPGQAA